MAFFRKKQINQKRQENYDRVYQLHQDAEFLFYVEEAYKEDFEGQKYIKLEGVVAKGTADLEDSFVLFNCNGLQKGVITLEEMYIGKDRVNGLYAGDKRVALYPLQQDLPYKAGDFVCKMGGENGSNS